MEALQGAFTFLLTWVTLNVVAIAIGSKMRFGWYEKGKG